MMSTLWRMMYINTYEVCCVMTQMLDDVRVVHVPEDIVQNAVCQPLRWMMPMLLRMLYVDPNAG